jgi:hypothetical protein
MSMTLIDSNLELTDATGLTGLHKDYENLSSCQNFDENCRSTRDRFLDILGEFCMQ